jgi:hypothetical protein
MPKTGFTPRANGFHFTNRFVNNIVQLPLYGNITTLGRCGGMSYAALDCYYSNTLVPFMTDSDYPSSGGVPADGTPLADYIFHRQVDSFLTPSAAKLVTWSVAPDVGNVFVRGVMRWSREDEFAKLRASIDAGKPAPLGLIVARDLNGLAHNHQVVAWGYEVSPANEGITLYLYDNNHPDQEVTLQSDRNTPGFQQSTGEQWRGFFVQDYSMQRPPANIAIAPVSKALFASKPTTHIRVTFERVQLHGASALQSTAQAALPVALRLDVNGCVLRWPDKGARRLSGTRRYPIARTLDVDVAAGEPLVIQVSAIEPTLPLLPLADNDAPVSAIRREYGAHENWGRGRHSDDRPDIYHIEYSID